MEAGNLYFIEQNVRLGVNAGRIQLYEVNEETGRKGVSGKTMIVSAYVPED